MSDLASLVLQGFSADWLGKPLWMWSLFLTVVAALLALDLGVLHRRCHVVSMREGVWMSAFYVTLGLAFGAAIWVSLGPDKAYAYWTGFIVEKTLAMDNLFVIATIFAYFSIPPIYQHRVLFWGVLGVIVLRGLMIGAGVALVTHFEWVLLVFAAFLVFTGFKLMLLPDKQESFGDNRLLRFLQRRMRLTKGLRGEAFFVREPDSRTGRMALHATPLFLALLLIEFADIVFAVDSIPAIFAITTDTYIVYTSNIFAILGLRALFFVLAALIERFQHLKYALATLLIFIGAKVLAAEALGIEKVPQSLSLIVTFVILGAGVAYSFLRAPAKAAPAPASEPAPEHP